MVDRQKVEAILTHRFPDATRAQIAAAANAIMGLDDEWEEMVGKSQEFGYHYSDDCRDICYLAREFDRGSDFRLFRRRYLGEPAAPGSSPSSRPKAEERA
jgi:hypothetical protein